MLRRISKLFLLYHGSDIIFAMQTISTGKKILASIQLKPYFTRDNFVLEAFVKVKP